MTQAVLEMREIEEARLRELLENPETAEKTIEEYFEVSDEAGPFAVGLVLREDVRVIEEGRKLEGIGSGLLSVANRVKRRGRLKKYTRMIEQGVTRRVVSEGDSWFQHPRIKDIVDQLSTGKRFEPLAILSLGAAGDDVWEMVGTQEYVEALQKVRPQVMLFSGGGNDLLGEEFHNFVRDYTPGDDPARLIQLNDFNDKLGQILRYYRQMLNSVKEVAPETRVIGHTYGYACQRQGKWLAKPMKAKGIERHDDQKRVIAYMVDCFHDQVLVPIKREFEGTFDFADVRREILLLEDWSDEIHPTKEGFFHVANRMFTLMEPFFR